MFRGAEGRVESSALAVQPPQENPSALQYQQQQQQQAQGQYAQQVSVVVILVHMLIF